MKQIKFEQLIGQKVIVSSNIFTPNLFETVKLVGVEESGIWIESKYLDEQGATNVHAEKKPTGASYFVPFHKISLVCVVPESA